MMFSIFNNRVQSDQNASQKVLAREVDYAFESLKFKLSDKLENLKELCINQVNESNKRAIKKGEPFTLDADALKIFEKNFLKELESLRYNLINQGKPFCPSVVHTIEVPANIGFNYGANVYNQKHNMIITCPSNSTVYFYDANEMAPMKQRRRKQISSSVVQMSYCHETDSHLMGCAFGDIYNYNATTNQLNKVGKEGDSFVLAITHIDANNYAFSSSKSNRLYFGNLNNENAVSSYSLNSDSWYLFHHTEKRLLLSGLANGKLAVYNTRPGPNNYKLVDSVQAHRFGKYLTVILKINIKGKEYILTGGNDHTMKIWHLVRGKVKLIKTVQTTEDVSTIVYLEDYQMIATTHHRDFVKFWSLPFIKLEHTLTLGLNKARNIFHMKDKNLLGVADLSRNFIKVIQLHPSENGIDQSQRD